jgi:hypothetical protein
MFSCSALTTIPFCSFPVGKMASRLGLSGSASALLDAIPETVTVSMLCPSTCNSCPVCVDDPGARLASMGTTCEQAGRGWGCDSDLSYRAPAVAATDDDGFQACLDSYMTALYNSDQGGCGGHEDGCRLPIIYDAVTGKPKALAMSLHSILDGEPKFQLI